MFYFVKGRSIGSVLLCRLLPTNDCTNGIRVSALHEIDADGDGVYETKKQMEYLNFPWKESEIGTKF